MPDSFANLVSLYKLWLKGCENLIELPLEFGNLHTLECLDLEDCESLEKVLDIFEIWTNHS